MSFIYRNSLLPAVSMWNSFSSIFQRFDSVWGKDGDVYKKKLYYYKSKEFIDNNKLKRFLKALGVVWSDFEEQEIDDEIDDIWFYINPKYEWDGSYAGDTRVGSTKETTQLVVPTAEEIAIMFNETFAIGEEITINVNYGGAHKRYIDSHELEWVINEAGVIESGVRNGSVIRGVLESDPWYYLANSTHLEKKKDSDQFQLYDGADYDMPKNTPARPSNRLLGTTRVSTVAEFKDDKDPYEILGIFAMMLNGGAFTRLGEVFDEKYITTTSADLDGETLNYSYSQKFTFNGMTSDNPLMTDMLSWFNQYKPQPTIAHRLKLRPVGEYRDDLMFHTKDTSYKQVLESLAVYQDPITGDTTRGVSNSLFSNDRLRVEQARFMRRRHFTEMIATSLETDYEVEEASTWEKVLAVVIIVVAIVVGVMSGGTLFGPAGIIWGNVAAGFGAMTLTLTVGMYALSMVGGLSAQGLVKIIGQVAQITGIIAAAAGIMAAVQNAGKLLAEQTLKEAGFSSVTEQMITQEMTKQTLTEQVTALVEQTFDSVTSRLTEFVSMDSGNFVSAISDGLEYINKGLEMYQDREMKELEQELKIAEEEADKAELETLSNQLKHPAALYELMADEIHSPDILSTMDRGMQSKIGGDYKFNTWYSNVNSV